MRSGSSEPPSSGLTTAKSGKSLSYPASRSSSQDENAICHLLTPDMPHTKSVRSLVKTP